jgi:hypothetical protein
MKAKLPHFFTFKSAKDLVRLGKKNDGGYLISQSDIIQSDTLIGLGVSDDWSFEENFVKQKDVPVYVYDASLNFKFWIKRTLAEMIKNPFNLYPLKKFISYKKFFKNDKKHLKKFVGLNTDNNNYCTLSSILDELNYQNIFMKIDIEGFEYRLLDTLILNQNRIAGLVLEFHDCDIHLDTIKKFIQDFDLNLVHIHANNCLPIRLDDELPLVLELTFSKYCELQKDGYLPHILDMPNDKNLSEINLSIEKE